MLVTPRQIAQATGLSESTVKRWCDRGILPSLRTPGGHRRLELAKTVRILKERGTPLLDVVAFGLPPFEELADGNFGVARHRLEEALIGASRQQVVAILHSLVLGGMSMAAIGDQVVAPVFARIGELWSCQQLEVYQEREACVIMQESLVQLKHFMEPPSADAPLAIGGALAPDTYVLPGVLVELVFIENGWQARYLGSQLPLETLREAVQRNRPEAFWLSISFVPEESLLIEATRHLAEVAGKIRSLFVLGGRSITEELEHRLACSALCRTLAHLELLLRTMPDLRRRVVDEDKIFGRP